MKDFASSSCNRLAKEIWTCCSKTNAWSAIHIPGKENNKADYMSRLLNYNTHGFSSSTKIFQ